MINTSDLDSSRTIRVANAPCSWGTLEFKGLGGAQVDCTVMLKELADTGYVGTELGDWGYMPVEATALKRLLGQWDLSLRGAFVPVALSDLERHNVGVEKAVRTAKLLAAAGDPTDPPFLVLADENAANPERVQHAGRITSEQGMTRNQWKVFIDGAHLVASAVREETGLKTVFHHHCAGFVETPEEIDHLLSKTDPQLIGLVLDTGHYVYGAGGRSVDFQELFYQYADRIWYLHFKDCEPNVAEAARLQGWDYFEAVGKGLFCELGQGCVDFSRIINSLREMDYQGWIVVEQDVLPGMGAPRLSAARNRSYLRNLGV